MHTHLSGDHALGSEAVFHCAYREVSGESSARVARAKILVYLYLYIYIYIYLGSRFQSPGLETWNLPDSFRFPKRFLAWSSFRRPSYRHQDSPVDVPDPFLFVYGCLKGSLGPSKTWIPYSTSIKNRLFHISTCKPPLGSTLEAFWSSWG